MGLGLLAGVLITSLVWLYITRKGQPILFRHRAPDGSLDVTTTTKVVGIVLSIVIVAGFCAAIVASAAVFLISGKILQPTPAWLDALESILFFLASMLGISTLGTWAKRKTASADVIEAQLRAQTGVAAGQPPREGINKPVGSPTQPPKPAKPPAAAVTTPQASVNIAPDAVPTPPERFDDGSYE